MYWIPLMLIALHSGSAQAVGPSELPDSNPVLVASNLLRVRPQYQLDYVRDINEAKKEYQLAIAPGLPKSKVIDVLEGFIKLEPIASGMNDEKFDCHSSYIDHLTSLRAILEDYSDGKAFSAPYKEGLPLVRDFSKMESAFLIKCLGENRVKFDNHLGTTQGLTDALELLRRFPSQFCFSFGPISLPLRHQAHKCIDEEFYYSRLLGAWGSFWTKDRYTKGLKIIATDAIDASWNICYNSCVQIQKHDDAKKVFENGVKLVEALAPTGILSDAALISESDRRYINDYLSYLLCLMTNRYSPHKY